jgi:DNA polymerase-3 subunit delta'
MRSSGVLLQDSFLYPWLKLPFDQLTQHPIPHALLLHSPKDNGELFFGLELANFLLCESQKHKPCGQCEACHWVKQGNHPDLFIVIPQTLKALLPFEFEDDPGTDEEDTKKQSKFIRIEQIRKIISSNELGSYRGGKRVVLIYPVEAMQIEAANCLLKTLEEPSDRLHFILITHQLERILPTIRSRCHLSPIPKPSLEIALSWLTDNMSKDHSPETLRQKLLLYSGSPLKVMSCIDENVLDESIIAQQLARFKLLHSSTVIELLGQNTLLDILNCILKWSFDLNLVLFGQTARYFPQYEKQMKSAVLKVNKITYQHFLTQLKEDLRLAHHPLFPKVQLEALLMRYQQLF